MPRHGPPGNHDPGSFFGPDVENMSPEAQATTALAVLVPVALSGVLLVAFAIGFSWNFVTYF